MVGQMFASLSLLFSNILIVQRREYYGLYIIIACALINVALNVALIPRFSLYGAAWATVIAEAANLVLLQGYAQWNRSWSALRGVIVVALGNIVFLSLAIRYALLNTIWVGVVAIMCNVGILFWMRLLQKDDVVLFLQPFAAKLKSITQRSITTETI